MDGEIVDAVLTMISETFLRERKPKPKVNANAEAKDKAEAEAEDKAEAQWLGFTILMPDDGSPTSHGIKECDCSSRTACIGHSIRQFPHLCDVMTFDPLCAQLKEKVVHPCISGNGQCSLQSIESRYFYDCCVSRTKSAGRSR